MGTTKLKFHPFSMIVPPKRPEFHGQALYTTPMSRNELPISLFIENVEKKISDHHFMTWEWYSDLVHEILVILVVLSSKMDGI